MPKEAAWPRHRPGSQLGRHPSAALLGPSAPALPLHTASLLPIRIRKELHHVGHEGFALACVVHCGRPGLGEEEAVSGVLVGARGLQHEEAAVAQQGEAATGGGTSEQRDTPVQDDTGPEVLGTVARVLARALALDGQGVEEEGGVTKDERRCGGQPGRVPSTRRARAMA